MADFGYDVSDYTGIHPMFGTLDQFDRLVAATRLGKEARAVAGAVPAGGGRVRGALPFPASA